MTRSRHTAGHPLHSSARTRQPICNPFPRAAVPWGRRRSNDMPGKTPFFITASLLVVTLALVLPDLDLETVPEDPFKGAAMPGMPGVADGSSAAETKP